MAIDFTFPGAVKTNVPALARHGINIVIGTTGWLADEAAVRGAVAAAGIGVVVAPNFSAGVVLFEAIVARASSLFAAQREFGAFLHEAHHAAKKDAPSGTALMLARAMGDAGFERPIDVSSTRAGLVSNRSPAADSTAARALDWLASTKVGRSAWIISSAAAPVFGSTPP